MSGLMKKIIISDFDDTIYVDKKINNDSIKLIKEFRKNNNLFIIASGSSYPSLLVKNVFEKIIDKYGYQEFQAPDSVVLKEIDSYSLKNENKIYLATEYTPKNNILKEYFNKNNQKVFRHFQGIFALLILLMD